MLSFELLNKEISLNEDQKSIKKIDSLIESTAHLETTIKHELRKFMNTCTKKTFNAKKKQLQQHLTNALELKLTEQKEEISHTRSSSISSVGSFEDEDRFESLGEHLYYLCINIPHMNFLETRKDIQDIITEYPFTQAENQFLSSYQQSSTPIQIKIDDCKNDAIDLSKLKDHPNITQRSPSRKQRTLAKTAKKNAAASSQFISLEYHPNVTPRSPSRQQRMNNRLNNPTPSPS